MATTTYLSNPTVTVNSVDFGDQCTAAEITYLAESQDITTFGDTARKYGAGLQNNQVTLTLFNSYGSSEVEATLYALVGTTTNLVLKASSAAISATNPQWTITGAYLESFTPLTASVGELSSVEVTFTGGTIARIITAP